MWEGLAQCRRRRNSVEILFWGARLPLYSGSLRESNVLGVRWDPQGTDLYRKPSDILFIFQIIEEDPFAKLGGGG